MNVEHQETSLFNISLDTGLAQVDDYDLLVVEFEVLYLLEVDLFYAEVELVFANNFHSVGLEVLSERPAPVAEAVCKVDEVVRSAE